MSKLRRPFLSALVAILVLALLAAHDQMQPGLETAIVSTAESANLSKLPLSFEPNSGQAEADVRFQAQTLGGTFSFKPKEIVLTFAPPPTSDKPYQDQVKAQSRYTAPGSGNILSRPASQSTVPVRNSTVALSLSFINANPTPLINADTPLLGRINYLHGRDPSNWITNLPTYGGITYHTIYPGIDLHYDGSGGQLKGTYTLAPGADPGLIRWRYSGASSLQVDNDGNLQLTLALTSGQVMTVTEQTPLAWQEAAGRRKVVDVSYILAPDGSVSFDLGAYDETAPLVIDPSLIYSTYFGSGNEEYAFGLALDQAHNTYITGGATAFGFPLSNPAQPIFGGGGYDAFVAKLDATGANLIYSTYIGGDGEEMGGAIAVDAAGNAYITGFSSSLDFPVANPYQGNSRGNYDVFVTKLNAAGSGLIYSTLIGGSENDLSYAIAVDNAGGAYVTGSTYSTDYPTVNPYQANFRAVSDGFVSKLSNDGATLLYSTYLGGGGVDGGYGIVADGTGAAYVTGATDSNDFPTTASYQPALRGFIDAWVVKLNSDGSTLAYATYLGGNGGEHSDTIVIDSQGDAYVVGYTYSPDFPTVGAVQPTYGGGDFDAFVAKLNPTGTALLYATFLGGISEDYGSSIALHSDGTVVVVGETTSTNFPLANPYQLSARGFGDAFAVKLSANGGALLYSTYIGGSGEDTAVAVMLDEVGDAYIAGHTTSTNFPLATPFQSVATGRSEPFVLKLDHTLTTPPTALPGPIEEGSGSQQLPRIDGALAVWEDNSSGSWDIWAKDLATKTLLPVYSGPSDQRAPEVSGNLVVWQDNRNGNWDIYAARLENAVFSAPFAIFVGPGDQTNPTVSQQVVVWQSSSPGSEISDIVSRDIVAGTVFTLTNGTAKNINPALFVLDGTVRNINPALLASNTAVWQSIVPTTTLSPPLDEVAWSIVGAQNITSSNPLTFTVPSGTGDQVNPDISGSNIVWQELHLHDSDGDDLSTDGPASPQRHGRWTIQLFNLITGNVSLLALSAGDNTNPAVSGNRVTYQDDPGLNGSWNVRVFDVASGILETVKSDITVPPLPDVSNETVIWQQNGASTALIEVSTDEQPDVYGNVGREESQATSTATGTNTPFPTPTPGTPTPTFTAAPTLPEFGSGADGTLIVHDGQTLIVNNAMAAVSAAGSSATVDTSNGFSVGDTVLFHQTQGADNVGRWELNKIVAIVTPNLWVLAYPLAYNYESSTGHAQVIRVAQYSAVEIQQGGVLTVLPWNGSTGGVLALLVSDQLMVRGQINLNGNWGANGVFIDGSGGASGGGLRGGNLTYLLSQPADGWQGEGVAGLGVREQTANANGGGGACLCGTRGAGGGNGTAGEDTGWNGAISYGGASAGTTDLSLLALGGGGGGGARSADLADPDSRGGGGGSGGGAALLFARVMDTSEGQIVADGGAGGDALYDTVHQPGFAGGGGAGGSILIKTERANLGVERVTAHGGWGGIGDFHGSGGSGGSGRITVQYCDSLSGWTDPVSYVQLGVCAPTATSTATPTATSTATPTATSTSTQVPPTSTPGVTTTPISFSDVKPEDYFYESIRYLVARSIVSGYSDNTFRPYNNTTRAQLTKIIVLAVNLPLLIPANPTFSDVPTDNVFYSFVETAVNSEIISGYITADQREFRPYNDVTRGQLSKIVVQAEGWVLLDPSTATFVDVQPGNPFYREIETAVGRGIISGYDAPGGREFRWGNNATRGQIAKIVYGAVQAR